MQPAQPAGGQPAQPSWTEGCNWIPKDNCHNSDSFACNCRKMNPSGPCTACPNSQLKQATSFQRKFESSMHSGVEFGSSSRWFCRAAIVVLGAVAALIAFTVLKRRRLVT